MTAAPTSKPGTELVPVADEPGELDVSDPRLTRFEIVDRKSVV